MATLFLHVGPPRTATTFLQDEVLSKVRSVEVLAKPDVPLGSVKIRFARLFDFAPAVWKDLDDPPFARLLPQSSERRERSDLIISDEGFFGGVAVPQPWLLKPQALGALRVARQTNNCSSPVTFALHLSELSEAASNWGFDRVKVAATVRRQDTKMASGYAKVSDRVRGASQASFERWARFLLHEPVGYYLGGGQKWDYARWWQKTTQVVGRDNVLLTAFELLREDPSEFLRRWLDFLEVEEAASIIEALPQSGRKRKNQRSEGRRTWRIPAPIRTGLALRPRRAFRALGLPTNLPKRWPDFSRDKHIRLTKDLSEEILQKYENGNRILDKAAPSLQLARHGYY